MKKTYFLLIALCFFATSKAQIVNIPDANFKAKLLAASSSNKIARDINDNYIKIDVNNNNEIEISEALNIFKLDISNLNSISSIKITNVTGLSFFTNLNQFYCFDNSLSNLDLSTLYNLRVIGCTSSKISNFNITGLINLESIQCNNNRINNLDLTNKPNLKYLDCIGNNISNLNLSSLINLEIFSVSYNPLSVIDLQGLNSIRDLQCMGTNITSLDVSNLSQLDLLMCGNNPYLQMIIMKNGSIESGLNMSNLPSLKYVCVDEGELTTIQNQIKYSSGSVNCNVNTYCYFNPGGQYYSILGKNNYDIINDGCDITDFALSYLKFNITNGTVSEQFISNASGSYSIPVQAGTHTITPKLENPTYFTVSPTTVNVTFPTQTSPFTQNFCIAPNGVRPDLEVTLLPIRRAIPGFDAMYKIVYKNKGNTNQSGLVNLTFNDAVLDLIVSNPVATTQTTNNLSWDFSNLLPFETREITFTLNVNSPMETPAVNNGDILNFTTTIPSSTTDETPLDNTFTLNQTVVGSYDPNDKTCLEGSVITPALIGQYVHYLIRFENTGTFAATNVVVKDMIDLAKFDISTLVSTSASHSFTTKISEGNKVEFIFENINLPFDNANNDGYIAFKIKTKPTLVVNDSFTNEANIYFDYNFPILTNKATSTFKTLSTQDFDFTSYFTLYPNPATADLNITAKETINVKSISVYNTLGQLVLVVTNADKVSKIDVSSLTSGNYFIKINSDKGTSNTRFIKE